MTADGSEASLHQHRDGQQSAEAGGDKGGMRCSPGCRAEHTSIHTVSIAPHPPSFVPCLNPALLVASPYVSVLPVLSLLTDCVTILSVYNLLIESTVV